jgi:D-alanyl-D-alanine carboxypeptidase
LCLALLVAGCAGPSPAPSAAQRLQAALETVAEDQHALGVSAAVIIPGAAAWSGTFGRADPDAQRPVTPDTVFAIASITKTYVAALVLRLVERGALRLDAPLSAYLDPPAAVDPAVTVRQLLNQTSGVGDYVGNDDLLRTAADQPSRAWTPDELLTFIGPPDFAPGTDWGYSNANYLLLGQLIVAVTGRSVEANLSDLTERLDLAATVFQPDRAPTGSLAIGSSFFVGGSTDDGSGLLPNRGGATLAWAAGGIASTASEVARWGEALYGGRVLTPASMAAMLEMVPVVDDDLQAYGLGVELRQTGGVEAIGHNGRTLGYATRLDYLRESGICIAVLANADGVDVSLVASALARVALDLLQS